jgi:hypothetical protein
MAPDLRTSLFAEIVLAALGAGAEGVPPVRVETTGPYTAVLSVAEAMRWMGGMRLALTTNVGGVSQAVISAIWSPDSSEPLRKHRRWCMERLVEAVEAEPAVTEAVLDETYGTSILVRLSYGRARIIREGNNG